MKKIKQFLNIKIEYIRRVILSYILRVRYNDMRVRNNDLYVYIPDKGFVVDYDFFSKDKYIFVTLYYKLSSINGVIMKNGLCVYYKEIKVYSSTYKEIIEYLDIIYELYKDVEVGRLLKNDIDVAITMKSLRYINNV